MPIRFPEQTSRGSGECATNPLGAVRVGRPGGRVEQHVDRLLRAAGGCGLAFLLVLGVVAVLPRGVRDAVPDPVIGGAVLVLGALGARRVVKGSS